MEGTQASVAAWLRLSLTPGLTGAALRRLLGAMQTPAAILSSSHSALTQLVDPALADALLRGPVASQYETALAWGREPNQAILVPDAPHFPELLRHTADPPPVLYAAGRIDLLETISIAVVGSRNATAQGMRNAEQFARAMSDAGCCIVSGLALGIDAAAHRGGLAGPGSSIAVLGNGIDVTYPRRNAALFAELKSRGLVLSEFALGTAPLAANFPRRNRLISGISRGCLVVEAAIPSGSLITARIAAELGREVFAIPGSIHSPLSKGCHYLIKQGAKLVESAQDVLEEFNIAATARREAPLAAKASADGGAVLRALGHDPCTIDALIERTNFSVDRLLAALTQLEIDGHVTAAAGGRYQRVV
jgi:DNA processing protein